MRGMKQFFLTFAVSTVVGLPLLFAELDSQSAEAANIDPVEIQKALNGAGFYKGAIDGIVGVKTRAAIRAFQTANNLSVDGVSGPHTWEKLKVYLKEETPVAPSSGDISAAPVDESTETDILAESEPKAEGDNLKQKLVS